MQSAARVIFIIAAAFAFVMASLPHPPPIPGKPPDTLLHILTFAILGILAAIGFPARSVTSLFSALFALGAAIELVQAIPSLNRDSELADLLADMGAALIALVLARRLLAWKSRRSERPV